MDKFTTWQEGETWYAAPSDYSPDAPVGEGETEEYAIIELKLKIEKLNEEWLFAWETRNDEP
jgi:hypothetical protein